MDWAVLMVLSLSRAGYGTITEIKALPVQWVLDAFEHMTFSAEYQETEHELNRPKT